MAERRSLSSIDMLPEEAADDIVWATQQLAARSRTQSDILFELNDRLEAKGIEGISKSAFSRYSVTKAAAQRRMMEARAMFDGVSSQFNATDVDENTVVLGEFIKTLIIELVSDAGGVKGPKEAMELARAFQATVAAQKISTDRRTKLEAQAKDRLMKAAEAAVGEVEGSGKPVDGAAVLKKIREDVYGIFER
ncbi:phage protein Gp27 family protein [Methylorubrum extorquens]|uniref:phage protein Gp27 family protein n=1 Tax=Methylorubrum extorquens TaxID=408 RepID=UPI003F607C6E